LPLALPPSLPAPTVLYIIKWAPAELPIGASGQHSHDMPIYELAPQAIFKSPGLSPPVRDVGPYIDVDRAYELGTEETRAETHVWETCEVREEMNHSRFVSLPTCPAA